MGCEALTGHVLGGCSRSLSSWAWILSSSSRRSFARTTWGGSHKQLGRMAPSLPGASSSFLESSGQVRGNSLSRI